MKLVSILLAVYLLGITSFPCTDSSILGHPIDTSEIHSSDSDHDHDHSEDSCPPTCHCTCCGMIVFYPSETAIALEPIELFHFYTFSYQFDYSFIYSNRVWHPPAIIS